MVFLRVLSDSSLKTVCSGLMSRSTTQRSFIDSLCEDVLPEEKFLRLSFFGPLLVHTHSVCAISVWIVKPRVRACEPSTSASDFGFTATS